MIKLFYYLVPAIVIAFFIAIMNAGAYLKAPWREDDNVPKYFQMVEADVKTEQWSAAKDDLDKLEKAWKIVIRRVQFDVERDELNRLSANLARLEGSIEAEDKGSALAELAEAREHWEELEQ
jgi:predicted Mrr-cat superfamily restriction endonuclease